MSNNPHLEDPRTEIEREGRLFRVEYEPSPLATGWMLRERHHDGWPVMAGPFDDRDDAVDQIAELLEAGPLSYAENERGARRCWVRAQVSPLYEQHLPDAAHMAALGWSAGATTTARGRSR